MNENESQPETGLSLGLLRNLVLRRLPLRMDTARLRVKNGKSSYSAQPCALGSPLMLFKEKVCALAAPMRITWLLERRNVDNQSLLGHPTIISWALSYPKHKEFMCGHQGASVGTSLYD